MAPTTLHAILHRIRLCLRSVLAFLFGAASSASPSSGSGLSLSGLFGRERQLTFDNGLRVAVGERIAEGGFSYVYEARLVSDGGGSGPRRSASALAADGADSSDGEEGRRRYALKRISCGDPEIVQVREDVVWAESQNLQKKGGPSPKAYREPTLAAYRSFWTGYN